MLCVKAHFSKHLLEPPDPPERRPIACAVCGAWACPSPLALGPSGSSSWRQAAAQADKGKTGGSERGRERRRAAILQHRLTHLRAHTSTPPLLCVSLTHTPFTPQAATQVSPLLGVLRVKPADFPGVSRREVGRGNHKSGVNLDFGVRKLR